MLEKEGVVFDCDGKIDLDCFVDVSSVSSTASAVSSTTAQGGKKRKADDNTTSTTKKKTKSKYFTDTTTTQAQSTATPTISKDILKQEILTLLQKRQVGKTC